MPRRLLLLNWRDPWHPKAGGAEHLTLRVLERLARERWTVEWFSGNYSGALAAETRGGIRYVRRGSAITVQPLAFARYARSRRFDVIVDQINTIPFFTPIYATRSIAWFQQLAREVWLYEGGPFGAVGFAAEALYLKPYRRSPLLTISASSAQSLRDIGLGGSLRIIPMAVDEPAEDEVPAKAACRDVVVVGRLVPSKRVEESLEAVALLVRDGWQGRLHVVGSGPAPYRAALEGRVRRLGIASRVIFHGRVDDGTRALLLRESSVMWMTSVREGWGLAITEAARHGTPAVVYDVPGLRDAVASGRTGMVVPASPLALAKATFAIFDRFETFASRALEDSRPLNWDRTAAAFARAVDELVPLESR